LTARLWTASNPDSRDFRLETFGKHWQATPLQISGPNTYIATVPTPSKGWTASFAEFTFDVGARSPLTITTDVYVTPETLPHSAPRARETRN
jgi:PhoPQ-activated pathogenicity-related protein